MNEYLVNKNDLLPQIQEIKIEQKNVFKNMFYIKLKINEKQFDKISYDDFHN